MANLKDIIYLSNSDYETLVANGQVTIGSATLTYDENNLYITPEENYQFTNGTNKFTVTFSDGTSQEVIVTPSIPNNITGSGASGYLTKFNGTNTITQGPQLSSTIASQTQSTKFLREDGTWAAPTYTENTNTDTLVKQTAKTDSVEYKILTTNSASPTSGDAAEAAYDTEITINPDTHTLTTSNLKSNKNVSILNTNTDTGILGFQLKDMSVAPLDVVNIKIDTFATSSLVGVTSLTLGSSVSAGRKYSGKIQIYDSNSHYGTICYNNNLTDNKNYYLPDSSGTIALTSSDITGNAATATNLSGTKTANYVYAGPASGNAAAPAFRALVAADIPDLSAEKITSGTLSADRLATSGATAGNYGDNSNQTPTYGATFKVPYITVDNKGRVTSISEHTVKIPDSDNTNTASAADNILDGSNSGTIITYAPYTAQQSKLSFDTSTTNPNRTDRLNLNGYLYATKLYSNGMEVLTSHAAQKYHKTGTWSNLTYTATAVNSADELKFTIPTGTTDTTVAIGNHTHGNISNVGELSTASRAVVTDANKKITVLDLAVSSATAETDTATTFVYSVTQNSQGKITVKTRPLPTYNNYILPEATANTLGGVTIGDGITVNNGQISVTAANLGLSNALHFIGISTSDMTDGQTSTPTFSGISNYTPQPGDVVLAKNSASGSSNKKGEFIYIKIGNNTGWWELLGDEGSYKILQTAITKPTETTNKWISAIGQNANGDIDVSYSSLNTSGTWTGVAEKANKIKIENFTDYATQQEVNSQMHYYYFSSLGAVDSNNYGKLQSIDSIYVEEKVNKTNHTRISNLCIGDYESNETFDYANDNKTSMISLTGANGYGTIQAEITEDRLYLFPNQSGTVALTSDISTYSLSGDAAPNQHTHTVVVSGTTGSNSSGALTVVTNRGTFIEGSGSFYGNYDNTTNNNRRTLVISHNHTSATLSAQTTGSAAKHAHTHSYGSSTPLTTSNNNGSAITLNTNNI